MLYDVLNALRQRVPSPAKVAVEHFNELGSRNMADVLVGEVGNTRNRMLLNSPFNLLVVVSFYLGDLETSCLVFLNNLWFVNLHFLNVESALDDI